MNVELTHKDFGYSTLVNEALVVHCHHYNTTLQRTLLEPEYLNLRPYLEQASFETAYLEIKAYCEKMGISKLEFVKKECVNMLNYLGFGDYDIEEMTEDGGKVNAKISHYSNGWFEKMGESPLPVDLFGAGFIRAIFTFGFSQSYDIVQTECISMRHSQNVYEINKSNRSLKDDISIKLNPVHHVVAPGDNFKSGINSDEVTTAVLGLPIYGNEEGIIDAFNVYLARTFGNYYNRISFRFEELLNEQGGMIELAEQLLIESAHNCGFYTMGNIMMSPEFDALVASKTNDKVDWLHGIISVINGLSWGQWRLMEANEDQMTLRVYNSYEAVGYKQLYGNRNTPCCYMIRGVAASLMNLIFLGDIQSKPELNSDYYNKLYNSEHTYSCEEISCASDAVSQYCEFVIRKS